MTPNFNRPMLVISDNCFRTIKQVRLIWSELSFCSRIQPRGGATETLKLAIAENCLETFGSDKWPSVNLPLARRGVAAVAPNPATLMAQLGLYYNEERSCLAQEGYGFVLSATNLVRGPLQPLRSTLFLANPLLKREIDGGGRCEAAESLF